MRRALRLKEERRKKRRDKELQLLLGRVTLSKIQLEDLLGELTKRVEERRTELTKFDERIAGLKADLQAYALKLGPNDASLFVDSQELGDWRRESRKRKSTHKILQHTDRVIDRNLSQKETLIALEEAVREALTNIMWDQKGVLQQADEMADSVLQRVDMAEDMKQVLSSANPIEEPADDDLVALFKSLRGEPVPPLMELLHSKEDIDRLPKQLLEDVDGESDTVAAL
jgi:chromosome segregation ATPase